MVIPLVYHCFVFLTALPLWSVNPASCVILLIGFHTLFLLLVVSYWKVIFTDAGGVPYELDEAWVRDCLLFHAADFCNAFPPCQCMLFEGHAGSFPPTDDARSPVATLRTTPSMHVLQCVRARDCVCIGDPLYSFHYYLPILITVRCPVCPFLRLHADFRAQLGPQIWAGGRGFGACIRKY